MHDLVEVLNEIKVPHGTLRVGVTRQMDAVMRQCDVEYQCDVE